MKYIYGLLLFAWLAFMQVTQQNTDILGITSLLGALCLFIINVKYFDSTVLSVVFAAGLIILSFFENNFVILIGIPLFECTYKKQYAIVIPALAAAFALIIQFQNYQYIFYILTGILYGYVMGVKESKEKRLLEVLDDERRARYELEQMKNDLQNSKKEIVHLTEIRERNRIAHQIHDNIGHAIAGVLFQLQGAATIVEVETERQKLKEILELCTRKLVDALEMARNTVYNIKSEKSAGLDQIKSIIDNFSFCRIEFEHFGDFGKVSASNLEILESNIREALTNASKYSAASLISIKIDIKKDVIHFYYKDNGKGCNIIKENVGLSGMRMRVEDTGGSISIDGRDGFLIMTDVPNEGF